VEVAAAAATLSKREFMMSWFSFVIINICVGLVRVCIAFTASVLWIIMDCALRPLRAALGALYESRAHTRLKNAYTRVSEYIMYARALYVYINTPGANNLW
jgi:hypothetical protein